MYNSYERLCKPQQKFMSDDIVHAAHLPYGRQDSMTGIQHQSFHNMIIMRHIYTSGPRGGCYASLRQSQMGHMAMLMTMSSQQPIQKHGMPHATNHNNLSSCQLHGDHDYLADHYNDEQLNFTKPQNGLKKNPPLAI